MIDAIVEAQGRVEESIADVKEMIQERVGIQGDWQREWSNEVQKLLEMDAGWGWKGFWQMIQKNFEVRWV